MRYHCSRLLTSHTSGVWCLSRVGKLKCCSLMAKYGRFEFKDSKGHWARYTNNLHQCKASFGIKKLPSGFTKDMQWKVSNKKTWIQLLLYICIYRMRVFKWMQGDLVKFAVLQMTGNAPKKACLKPFCSGHQWILCSEWVHQNESPNSR